MSVEELLAAAGLEVPAGEVGQIAASVEGFRATAAVLHDGADLPPPPASRPQPPREGADG